MRILSSVLIPRTNSAASTRTLLTLLMWMSTCALSNMHLIIVVRYVHVGIVGRYVYFVVVSRPAHIVTMVGSTDALLLFFLVMVEDTLGIPIVVKNTPTLLGLVVVKEALYPG